jgi:sporulation protein YlmC with PRC-barrel domain
MQRNVKSLIGFSIGATDGEIGKADDFYFDDERWTVRYLIVKTGGWLFGKKVLISPAALHPPYWDQATFPVNLTKAQIEGSPDTDTDKPVSRQHEIDLHDHYSWPYSDRVGSGFYGGMGMMGMMDSRVPLENQITDAVREGKEGDPHLRSATEMIGYDLYTVNGQVGTVEDFVIDDQTWTISYLVIDTGTWVSGKKVLIAPQWIRDIKWETSSLKVDLTTDAIENSPVYDPALPLEEDYEKELYVFYGKSKEI